MQLALPLAPEEPLPQLVRHRRARRYILRVLDDGSLRVTLPRWGSRREALRLVEASRTWIDEQRAQRQARPRPWLPDEAALRRRARTELPAELLRLAAGLGIDVGRVSVRDHRSRWGSCSRQGSITLNWRLTQMPPFVSDYVLWHELMHRRQANHSRRFWREVESVCPGWRDAERWLRRHGREVL